MGRERATARHRFPSWPGCFFSTGRYSQWRFTTGVGRRSGRLCGCWLTGLISGLVAVGCYGVFIWALSLGAMGTVAALRETSVLFAPLIGPSFFASGSGRRALQLRHSSPFEIVLIAKCTMR
jgi:hypothetical protein